MKRFILTAILISGSAISVCAKAEIAPCPTLDVQGGGVIEPESPMSFSATVGGAAKNLKLEYVWTVSQGKIIEGQGTPSIKVEIEGKGSVTVTATVEVKGFPENCTNADSETGSLIREYRSRLFDEFGALRDREVKTRIENLFTELAEEPTFQGYLIIYGTNREIAAHESQIHRVMKLLKLDKNRIKIANGGTNYRNTGVWTKVWIVPPGDDFPTPDME